MEVGVQRAAESWRDDLEGGLLQVVLLLEAIVEVHPPQYLPLQINRHLHRPRYRIEHNAQPHPHASNQTPSATKCEQLCFAPGLVKGGRRRTCWERRK